MIGSIQPVEKPILAWVSGGAILVSSLLLLTYLTTIPMNWDSAWYLDATSRFVRGARLYRDIIEINPPLSFIETALLTGGHFSKLSFLIGTTTILAISALWCGRLRGPLFGIVAFIALALSGIQHFGQRDHQAIIFALPYLLMPRETSRREQVLLGLFAFFGFALKPQLIGMAVLASGMEALSARSWRPIFSAANWTLVITCNAYLAATALLFPAYFTEMIPLGRAVYFAYSGPVLFGRPLVWLTLLATAMSFLKRDPFNLRISVALLGALAGYFVQGKGFPYQLAPALCLSVVALYLTASSRSVAFMAGAGAMFVVILSTILLIGPYRSGYAIHVPPGSKVLVLSDRVSAAYPAIIEQRLVSVSRYPAIWPVPGAWATLHDPSAPPTRRAQAASILADTKAVISADIADKRPDYILADTIRSERFGGTPFSWVDWVTGGAQLPSYSIDASGGEFTLYRRVSP